MGLNVFLFEGEQWLLTWLCENHWLSRKRLNESSQKRTRLDTWGEVGMYRERRRTCFDWLRVQPRACSTAAAWGIAVLWFFCFGWWKDYLQSPTIAQKVRQLGLNTCTHARKRQEHTPCSRQTCRLVRLVIGCRLGSAMGDHGCCFKQQI